MSVNFKDNVIKIIKESQPEKQILWYIGKDLTDQQKSHLRLAIKKNLNIPGIDVIIMPRLEKGTIAIRSIFSPKDSEIEEYMQKYGVSGTKEYVREEYMRKDFENLSDSQLESAVAYAVQEISQELGLVKVASSKLDA